VVTAAPEGAGDPGTSLMNALATLTGPHRQIVGPVYQFRHAALQDHLAPPGKTTPATVAADLSTVTG
jgi:hypothetical protein